jgi:hypothetical protein
MARVPARCTADRPVFRTPLLVADDQGSQFVLRYNVEVLVVFDRSASEHTATSAKMAGCFAKLGVAEHARELMAQCLAIQFEATTG